MSRAPRSLPDWEQIDTVFLDMDGTLLDLRFDNYFWRELVPQRYAERNGMTIYELRLNPEDVGRIIGKQGMTINAIRSLLTAGSARKGLRCSLEIIEDRPPGE